MGNAVYIALLRAVNVGGTGKLPMAELRAIAAAVGFFNVKTFIASGNLIFESRLSPAKVKAILEQRLEVRAGKPVGVFVRPLPALAEILKCNPFPDLAPNRTVVFFLDKAPSVDTLDKISGRKNEQILLANREIYVHYPDGTGSSKLKISAAAAGTARNMNTLAKLVELAAASP